MLKSEIRAFCNDNQLMLAQNDLSLSLEIRLADSLQNTLKKSTLSWMYRSNSITIDAIQCI